MIFLLIKEILCCWYRECFFTLWWI